MTLGPAQTARFAARSRVMFSIRRQPRTIVRPLTGCSWVRTSIPKARRPFSRIASPNLGACAGCGWDRMAKRTVPAPVPAELRSLRSEGGGSPDSGRRLPEVGRGSGRKVPRRGKQTESFFFQITGARARDCRGGAVRGWFEKDRFGPSGAGQPRAQGRPEVSRGVT